MPRFFSRSHNNELDDSSSTSSVVTSSTMNSHCSTPQPLSPNSNINLAARIQRRMKRGHTSKFDALAKDEQRHLTDEIKTDKTYIRNLQKSYKSRTSKKCKGPFMQVLAKKHVTDLSEEISICEQELKMEESLHSIDSSVTRSRRNLFRRPSLTHEQTAPTAA